MKFPYKVRHNGVDYPIGADVPIEESFGGSVETPTVVSSGKVNIKSVKKYSESSLPSNIMKIKSLAKSEGMNVDKTTKKEDMVNYLLNIEG